MNKSMRSYLRRGLGAAAVLAILLTSQALLAADAAEGYVPFDAAKTTWHGFDRYNYVMDDATGAVKPAAQGATGRQCIVVVPKKAAPGYPWSWRACYWDHRPQAEIELLRRGFHIAFIAPTPGKQWDAWYTYLTEKHGLSKKPAFIGMSMGGYHEYTWATANPDKVSAIYADNPAIRQEDIAKLAELARRDVPLLNVCGSLDFVLGCTKVIEKRLSPGGRPDHDHDQGRHRPSPAQFAGSQGDRRLH